MILADENIARHIIAALRSSEIEVQSVMEFTGVFVMKKSLNYPVIHPGLF